MMLGGRGARHAGAGRNRNPDLGILRTALMDVSHRQRRDFRLGRVVDDRRPARHRETIQRSEVDRGDGPAWPASPTGSSRAGARDSGSRCSGRRWRRLHRLRSCQRNPFSAPSLSDVASSRPCAPRSGHRVRLFARQAVGPHARLLRQGESLQVFRLPAGPANASSASRTASAASSAARACFGRFTLCNADQAGFVDRCSFGCGDAATAGSSAAGAKSLKQRLLRCCGVGQTRFNVRLSETAHQLSKAIKVGYIRLQPACTTAFTDEC